MKAYLDCSPRLMSQALNTARAATDDEETRRQVVNAMAGLIPELSLGKQLDRLLRAFCL